MELIVTQSHIDRAIAAGACGDGMPKLGDTPTDMTQDQLVWAEQYHILTEGESDALPAPLWVMSGSGSGYGYGSGYGDGSGYGSGSGSGSGYGSGDGYGDGSGSSSGYGSGCGDGSG